MLLGDLIFLAIYNGKFTGEQKSLIQFFWNMIKNNFAINTGKRNSHMGSSNNGHETSSLSDKKILCIYNDVESRPNILLVRRVTVEENSFLELCIIKVKFCSMKMLMHP